MGKKVPEQSPNLKHPAWAATGPCGRQLGRASHPLDRHPTCLTTGWYW